MPHSKEIKLKWRVSFLICSKQAVLDLRIWIPTRKAFTKTISTMHAHPIYYHTTRILRSVTFQVWLWERCLAAAGTVLEWLCCGPQVEWAFTNTELALAWALTMLAVLRWNTSRNTQHLEAEVWGTEVQGHFETTSKQNKTKKIKGHRDGSAGRGTCIQACDLCIPQGVRNKWLLSTHTPRHKFTYIHTRTKLKNKNKKHQAKSKQR